MFVDLKKFTDLKKSLWISRKKSELEKFAKLKQMFVNLKII